MPVERGYELVSVDVGETILSLHGSGLTSRILAACEDEGTREALRVRLLTRPIDKGGLDHLLSELDLPRLQLGRAPATDFLPGARAALVELGRRHTVVTLSNTSSLDASTCDPISLEFPAMARYRSCEIGFAKPDRGAFERVLQSEDSRGKNAVHIGDSWECDVLGATAAGWSAIWISAEHQAPGSPDGLLAVVSSLRAAADFIMNGVPG